MFLPAHVIIKRFASSKIVTRVVAELAYARILVDGDSRQGLKPGLFLFVFNAAPQSGAARHE